MPRELQNTILLRAALIWVALRVFVAAAVGSVWSLPGLVVAFGITVVLILLDTEARGERIFLANLGVGRRRIVAVCFATIVLIEAALGIIAKAGPSV